MKRLLSLTLLIFSIVAYAADLKSQTPKTGKSPTLELHKARVAKTPTKIYVQFETPVALTDCDVEYPSRPGCSIAAVPWTVVAYDASGNADPVRVVSAVDPIGQFAANGLVTLTLASSVPDHFARVDVTFAKRNMPHVSIDPNTKASKYVTKPATSKENATTYLSGTFAPAVGATPDYSTDSKVDQPLVFLGRNQSSVLKVAATAQTDSKGTADPDGFYWGIPIQHFFTKPCSVQWSVAGMELDKRANAVNFVSAPSITGSLDHAFFRPDKKHPGVDTVAAVVGLDLTAGVEFGTNLRDKFVVANKPGQGEGAFFRGVPSATVSLQFPDAFHLAKIVFSSSYTARIPTTDELFVETRNTKTPIPLLTSQTRNYVQNTLQITIRKYLAIQIKHQYGSIPPAFSFVQNSGSIGLVFSLTQELSKDSQK